MTAQKKEKIVFALLFLAICFVILPIFLVFYYILRHGVPAITWEFLTAGPRKGMTEGGIFPAILGTFYLVIGTAFFSLPLGIMTALYLTEYAPKGKLTRGIRIAIVNLAGVPSIVYGLFGLALFVLFLRFGVSLLAGSLTLALLTLPVIITASEEALLAVPASFREASYALGVTKWQTIRNVVLPNALPGIITGTILGLSRAAGETAPILFTCAAYYLARLPRSPFDETMALPYHLYVIATQVPDAPLKIQYGTALVLLVLVFSLNISSIVVRTRFRRKKKW